MAMATAVLAVAVPGHALDCTQVDSAISPCLTYLRDGAAAAAPPRECCDAVKSLVSIAPSQQERQTACECLKAAAARTPIKADLAAGLPAGCGVSTTVPISPDVNCQNVG
ncbi:unnamed protein product [Cuscuta campestris]|nr:unnamed protein product [Cuscuta campestris]